MFVVPMTTPTSVGSFGVVMVKWVCINSPLIVGWWLLAAGLLKLPRATDCLATFFFRHGRRRVGSVFGRVCLFSGGQNLLLGPQPIFPIPAGLRAFLLPKLPRQRRDVLALQRNCFFVCGFIIHKNAILV